MSEKALIDMGERNIHMAFSLITYDGFPFLFVGRDEEHRWYLCLCSEIRWLTQWIVTQTNAIVIQDMLEKKITVKEAITIGDGWDSSKWLVRYMSGNGHEIYRVEMDDINALDLPDDGLYLEYPDDDAIENFYAQMLGRKRIRSDEVGKVEILNNERKQCLCYMEGELRCLHDRSNQGSASLRTARFLPRRAR